MSKNTATHSQAPAAPQTPASAPSSKPVGLPSMQLTPYQRALRWLDQREEHIKGDK